MDATEFNQYNQTPLYPEQFRLPKILSLESEWVKFTAPKFKHLKSHLEKYKEALQITIVTDGPIPARALTPVFFIGDYKAGYYMPGKKANEYHFYLFEFKKLKGKIPVRWGWNNDPPEKREDTGFSIEGSATRS
jgi:hypothetical protein